MSSEILYTPPQKILDILRGHGTSNRIIEEKESPQDLLYRVTRALVDIEEKFDTTSEDRKKLAQQFQQYFVRRDFIPGVPTLTNAGREGYDSSALSSCVVIPVDLRKESAREVILAYYRQNMGSGFNFTKYDDPVGMLRWLNKLSATESKTNRYDRRIANMGTLHVAHPKIREFIHAKVDDRTLVHFNISVEINDEFMEAAHSHTNFKLSNEELVDAYALLQEIAGAAWRCGDPGLVNLDRMNIQNPVSELAPYECTPPCGEMGLSPGETCQFGYINLAHFVRPDGTILKDKLKELVHFSVRILDNAIEHGAEKQPSVEGKHMAKLKRKIGLSVAGLADTLMIVGLPYNSSEGREFARDLLSYINFEAKYASINLANQRGSCGAMRETISNKYFSGYIENRYAAQATTTVSTEDWKKLSKVVQSTGKLRNVHHTALPPGGRASMILGVSHSIEPFFGPSSLNSETAGLVIDLIASSLLEQAANTDVQTLFNEAIEAGSFQHLPISDKAKSLLKTAIEINPEDHVLMTAALSGMNGVYDESASKTVNLPSDATADDVLQIYLLAHQVGLKNISVYRDGSLLAQPKKLS